MRTFALVIAIIVACPCLAAVDRPQVPVVLAVAVVPRAFDERPVQATVPKELPVCADSALVSSSPFQAAAVVATAGTAEPLKADSSGAFASSSPLAIQDIAANVGITAASKADPTRALSLASPFPAVAAAAKVGIVNPLTLSSVDEAAFVHMVLSCDDDAGLRDLLTGFGLTLRDPTGNARALPAFLAGVDCDGADALKSVIPGGIVRAVRYVGEADPAVAYVAAHPDQQFLIIADVDHLNAAALKTLAGPNVAAVVVGHFHAFDARPEDYVGHAEDVTRTVRAIRLVCDAPVLLAVSSMNYFTRRTEKSWADAFGDGLTGFDGWAVYNLNQFPAILESPTNLRQVVLARLGLTDKPCVLLDFLGGPVSWADDQAARLKSMWQAKGGAFVKALKNQCWRGVMVYSSRPADAEIKAAALGN